MNQPGLSNELGHKVTPVIPTGVARSFRGGQPGTLLRADQAISCRESESVGPKEGE